MKWTRSSEEKFRIHAASLRRNMSSTAETGGGMRKVKIDKKQRKDFNELHKIDLLCVLLPETWKSKIEWKSGKIRAADGLTWNRRKRWRIQFKVSCITQFDIKFNIEGEQIGRNSKIFIIPSSKIFAWKYLEAIQCCHGEEYKWKCHRFTHKISTNSVGCAVYVVPFSVNKNFMNFWISFSSYSRLFMWKKEKTRKRPQKRNTASMMMMTVVSS